MLAVENLTLARSGVTLFSQVTFKVRPGEIVGIVGRSGAGKTSLLRSVLGLEQQASGRVTICERSFELPAAPLSPTLVEARDNIGVFFGPESLLPYETMARRIARLSERRDSKVRPSEITSMAKSLEIDGLLTRYPHQLSMGQKARAGVLSTLSAGSRVVLLDEFGSNLDSATQSRLFALLDTQREDRAFLISSHASELLESIATRIFKIGNGTFEAV